MKNYKIGIFHDYFNNLGGGEKLVLTLAEKLHSVIFTSYFNKKILKKININKNKIIVFKKKFFFKNILSWFNYVPKKNYLINILSGNYSIFLNKKNKKKKFIYYCHGLPKAYFRYTEFIENYNFFKKILIFFSKKIFIKYYLKNLHEVNYVIANSKYTKLQLKKFYKKKITVIYPPINIKQFTLGGRGKYFLSANRHEKDKNINKIISVFKKLNKKKIIITSEGSQTKKLKEISKNNKNIIFTGLVSNSQYIKLLKNCIATIYLAKNEDFGMSAIESLSVGKPVIAMYSGGLKEILIKNQNCFLVNKNKIQKDLFKIISKKSNKEFFNLRYKCRKTIYKFNETNFLKKIKSIIKK
jgi:glycosyltransferase involved in cell wall biosynthesis